MKFRDIPSMDSMYRLIQVSFSTPAKNLAMYQLYESLKKHQGYVENERVKLIHKYGEESKTEPGKFTVTNQEGIRKFGLEFGSVLEAEIPEKIEPPEISEDDFFDENCSYPYDKAMWPNAKDISTFFNFCKLLKNEKSGD